MGIYNLACRLGVCLGVERRWWKLKVVEIEGGNNCLQFRFLLEFEQDGNGILEKLESVPRTWLMCVDYGDIYEKMIFSPY